MMVPGNRIEAERDGVSVDGDPSSVVPGSWQLLRKREGQPSQTLAKGVLGFDLLPDGGVVYFNGNVVYALDAAGARSRLATAEGITAVCRCRAERQPCTLRPITVPPGSSSQLSVAP